MHTLLFSVVVVLTNAFGRVEIDPTGALVRSYVPRGGRDVLFGQSADRQPGKWYHGGIPICWPWFGFEGDPGTGEHGFAFCEKWKVLSCENGEKFSKAVFGLEREGNYRLEYEVALSKDLSVRLKMSNLGEDKFVVTTGFHPYFSVSNPTNVLITTPSGAKIRCQAGMDGRRPYGEGVYCIHDNGWARRCFVDAYGNRSLIIWNVGPDGKEEGLEHGDWERYLCVEPAIIPRAHGFYLLPGETRDIGCRIWEEAEEVVIGRIDDVAYYEPLNSHFAKAFEFLRRKDLAELPVGRYEIDGESCWAMIQEANLTPMEEETTVEAHRQYIDIQSPITGDETIGLCAFDTNRTDLVFDKKKDIVFFKAKVEPRTLHPGEFAIFFPRKDAHAPGHCIGENRTIRKLVIKVRAE